MTTQRDLDIMRAMVRFGGSFVEALGKAAMFADDVNLKRLKEAFPEHWVQYGDMVDLDKRGSRG